MTRDRLAGLLLIAVLGSPIHAADPSVTSITPRKTIRPFNGKDFSGFSTWLKKTGRDDPQHVFRVEDGMIRCGSEDMGYIATTDAYQDYHLIVEYKWGERNPDSKSVRNSGILLHGVGPDGSQDGLWMTSIECQLAQGCEGDLIVIRGKTADGDPYPATITSTTNLAKDGRTRWLEGGQKTVYSGKQFWWSKHQPFFEELIDARGEDDVASRLGEWTKVECLCAGPRITIKINGVTVNECFDARPAAGKILLQTEGHEVYFRNFELRPLPELADPLVYISAFAAGDQGGIHAYRVDLKTGALKLVHRTAGVENPFFLAVSPDRKFLYSIHAREFGGKDNEEVAAFEIAGSSGQLKFLNRQSARGTAACYLHVDKTGKTVLVANYSSGSVASLPIKEDGSLGEAASFFKHADPTADAAQKKTSHAHSILTSPDNKFVFAADLGLDQILSYRLDAASSKLTPNQPPFVRTPAGAGPRHITFHPNGKQFYAINELANSVSLFDYDADSGVLVEKQTISTLPKEFDGRSACADLKITPNGRFLYGTNRGHDSIAAYRIGDDGRLTLIGIEPSLGAGPQNLAIMPGGELLLCANLPGNNVAAFRIDPQTGGLKSAGPPVTMPSPSCIMVVP